MLYARLVLGAMIGLALLVPENLPAQTKKKAPAAARKAAKAPARKPAIPLGQAKPTKDRYIEIQQALVDVGYFGGPVNGVWGTTSVEALRQFQFDQGLEPTGKIDSLSLIRLKLGPTYDSPPSTSSAPANSAG